MRKFFELLEILKKFSEHKNHFGGIGGLSFDIHGSYSFSQKFTRNVEHWEYYVFDVTANGMRITSQVWQTLNQLGEKDWEPADTMVYGCIFMKRKLP